MTSSSIRTRLGTLALALACLAPALLGPAPAQAQDMPPQRQIRTYIPPDQLVSFLPSTPFDRFVEFLNPIVERVTGKQVVDPEERTDPIGISIAGMHFLDAMELVLQYKGLSYRETERFFIVEPGVDPAYLPGAADVPRTATAAAAAVNNLPASARTREIQINAILFEVDLTEARDVGINWDVFFGDQQSGGQGSSGGASGGGQAGSQSGPRFFLKTDEIFENVDDFVQAPDLIDFSDLTQFFRLLENEGIGETIAQPQVTVQSAEKGRIQIGSDVPVQVKDFAGNTVTQFFSTGIIVDVTPTLISETVETEEGAEEILDFIHMDVRIEKSGSRPSASGPVIDRNSAVTQVLLLDGEQTVIGGLYSTEEGVSRKGIPLLKDLPGWFFGLRYVFGRTQRTVTQNELLIVLQAHVLDPLQARANRPFQDQILERSRQQVRERLLRFNEEAARELPEPVRYREGSQR